MRLDKFISDTGAASRREASLMIKKGAVSVNGSSVKDPSLHIDPSKDEIICQGRRIIYSKYVYVMLNKPEGYVSATEDQNLPVVTELLSEDLQRMSMFPVGRLDRDTVGLMVLTNNGVLSHALLPPKRHVEKRYYAKFKVPLAEGAEEKFKDGITLLDGYECKSADIQCDSDRLSAYITLTEGKYHQIKRMIASLDNKVVYLERVSFGPLKLDLNLARGEYRALTDEEVSLLCASVPEALR